jgi:hypothetical protein
LPNKLINGKKLFKEEGMTVQSINNNAIGFGKENSTRLINSSAKKNTPEQLSNNFYSKNNSNANLTSAYVSTSKMTLNYSNKDGDSISLLVETVKYQKTILSQGLTADSENWHEIVENIKDEFKELQGYFIKKLIGSLDDKSSNIQENTPSKGLDGLPEYWNAENTSQRIVDFATSFYGIAESTGKGYYDIILKAIEEGFNQARELLGELPDEVSELTNKTYELVLEKLDEWAARQGIETQTGESVSI